jgi:hypothetical protein
VGTRWSVRRHRAHNCQSRGTGSALLHRCIQWAGKLIGFSTRSAQLFHNTSAALSNRICSRLRLRKAVERMENIVFRVTCISQVLRCSKEGRIGFDERTTPPRHSGSGNNLASSRVCEPEKASGSTTEEELADQDERMTCGRHSG